MKLSKVLYNITRTTGKYASLANDIETIMTGDPKKIAKRMQRKATYKVTSKIARKINNKLK